MCSARSEVRKWNPLEEHSSCLFSLSCASLQWWRFCSLRKQMVLSYSFQWKSFVKCNTDFHPQLWLITSCLVHSTHGKTSVPFCILSVPRDCFVKTPLSLAVLLTFSSALSSHDPSEVDSAVLNVGLCCDLHIAFSFIPCSVCFSSLTFTPSVPHVKWHPLSVLQILCITTASPLVFQTLFVQVVVLSQM